MGSKNKLKSFIMNTLRNKVSLIGRIGKTPELQKVGSSKDYALTKLSLATNENYKDKNGQWHEKTQWHNLVAWGKTAERISSLISKGQEVMIEGKIVNNSYEKDGEKRFTTDIEVADFLLISSNNKLNSTELEEGSTVKSK
jgi:single-strand DNA-binding protein